MQRVNFCRADDWLRESLGVDAQMMGAKKSSQLHHSRVKGVSLPKEKATTGTLRK